MTHSSFISPRRGIWLFVRRVPAALAHLDKRTFVRRSTKIHVITDPRGHKAALIAEGFNEEAEAYWRCLIEGRGEEEVRDTEAQRRAKLFATLWNASRGVRMEIVETQLTIGGAPQPTVPKEGADSPIMLSKLFEEYEALTEAARRDFSPDQVRKWRNVRVRAVSNILGVVQDLPMAQLSHRHALAYRDWWAARIIDEDMDVGTANRDMGVLSRMITTLDRRHRWGVGKVFVGHRIEGAIKKSRVPFSLPFLRDTFLAPGALDVLNDEARDAAYIIAETGLRLSEAVNLLPERIKLDAAVPHVQVRPDGRRLKTPESERDIPLVGVALEAARRRKATGFPRYRDKAAGFSAAVNKTLREHSLLETDRTIYSLRHSFEDRLGEVDAPEKMIAMLMGHKHDRPKYGTGPSLQMKQRWLLKIALR